MSWVSRSPLHHPGRYRATLRYRSVSSTRMPTRDYRLDRKKFRKVCTAMSMSRDTVRREGEKIGIGGLGTRAPTRRIHMVEGDPVRSPEEMAPLYAAVNKFNSELQTAGAFKYS